MKTKLVLLSLMLVTIASAEVQVLPTNAVVDGKTIGEWTAEWWKWILPIPVEQNPAFDDDGSFANVGQPDGSVFFLAKGYNTNRTDARSFTVPEGKYLFMPLITYYTDCIATVPCSVEILYDQTRVTIDLVTSVHATIDGVRVPELFHHRNISPVFSINFLSTDNLISWGLRTPFAGLDDPMVAEGYHLMLEPLTAGVHVLNFGATVGPPVNLTFDITDTITVVAVPLPERVQRLISHVTSSAMALHRQQPLLATLNAAKASFDSKNPRAGINELAAFQNKVRAQVGRNDPNLAEQLSQLAQEIIDKANAQLQ